MDPSCWDPNEKVSMDENEMLTRKFSEEEIKHVIFSMETNTAPGPDHIPIEFFQSCWDIVKMDIVEMFEEFFKHKLDIGRLNYGVITLLPNLKDPSKIQQYRPICLLNVLYKIFTKTLMLRLDSVLGRIINRCQSAFMKGRYIMDGIMCLHEILHDTRQKESKDWSLNWTLKKLMIKSVGHSFLNV